MAGIKITTPRIQRMHDFTFTMTDDCLRAIAAVLLDNVPPKSMQKAYPEYMEVAAKIAREYHRRTNKFVFELDLKSK